MPPVSCSSAARRERKQMWSTVLAGAAERIERAKADWSAGRILSVIGETDRGAFPPSL